ncbi:MAG: hypothetical protein QOE44_2428 [Solirubrobacteraceae bacterium]|jgi:hypothetical protein|nr:hypothetical protein [Solirubrobacteraceae bacterium]
MPPTGATGNLTPFFIPGYENDGTGAERLYDDLRSRAEADSGMVAHKRRIHRVMCRRNGADVTIEVGSDELLDGNRVIAILQVGRELYTVHCEDPDEPGRRSTVELAKRTVYAVTDFD